MRWEYHTIKLENPSEAELRAHLNVLGASGWELAACFQAPISGLVLNGMGAVQQPGALTLILKRPLES